MPDAPNCPLCDGALDAPFVERHGVPVLQNVLCATRDQARTLPRGDMVARHCPRCDFITNAAFDPARIHYGEEYENLQACSGVFDEYVDGLIDHLVESGLREKTVVEVGCGTGYFLRRLCERGENQGIGFDTAYRGPEEDGPVRFVRDLFCREWRGVRSVSASARRAFGHREQVQGRPSFAIGHRVVGGLET